MFKITHNINKYKYLLFCVCHPESPSHHIKDNWTKPYFCSTSTGNYTVLTGLEYNKCKNISQSRFLADKPYRKHMHGRLRLCHRERGFAGPNTSADVSMWLDFLWDRPASSFDEKKLFRWRRQDVAVWSGRRSNTSALQAGYKWGYATTKMTIQDNTL